MEGNTTDIQALRSELKKAKAALKRSKTGLLGTSVFCDFFAATS
jgi:hypothetical protein